MAFVESFEPVRKERQSVHKPTRCGYSIFRDAQGNRYLQLDTYGSHDRELTGKMSQSLQFNAVSAIELRALIDKTFPASR